MDAVEGKAIINGKRYDTSKADHLADAEDWRGGSDFRSWRESLYRTPKSKTYFIAGEGHAQTRWAGRYGDMRGWGRGILPLSVEDALAWCESHLTAEETERIFGESIQDA